MMTISAPAPAPRVRIRRALGLPAGFARSGLLGWRNRVEHVDIVHPFGPTSISDAAMVSSLEGLVHDGVLAGQLDFEDAAVGMIASSAPTPAGGWAAFYDNSIAELRDGSSPFGPIHRRARSLILGPDMLEVGSCFGFLALQCAEDGHRVTACDISPGAIAHLSCAAARRRPPPPAVVGDATELPFPTDAVDTVTLIHLLEHLTPADIRTALREALRVARRRVVIAVPFEEHPSAHFGHLVRLGEADLWSWAQDVEHAGAQVFTDHGGWLVLTPADESVR